MRRFVALYDALDATTATSGKVAALAAYFRDAPPADAAWALFVLSGRRFKRLLPVASLVQWTLELTGLPGWLFDESYTAVGDLAETCALLLDGVAGLGVESALADQPLQQWAERIQALRELDDDARRAAVSSWWRAIGSRERYVLNKLLTGEMRVGVSETLVIRGVAEAAGLPAQLVTQRMMGSWQPDADFFRRLTAPADQADPADPSRPYPFYLASPLEGEPAALGPRGEWLAEWKWDGIRAQLIRRAGEVHLWSRGEELITARFPEVVAAAQQLPRDAVLDGEVLAWQDGAPLPFAILQRRIGRHKLGPKILADAPVTLVAYDLLEEAGVDLRERPLAERRTRLGDLLAGSALPISPAIDAPDWAGLAALRAQARERRVEGLILKRLSSPYRAGRRKGDWWKWKIDPYSIDAVMIYAQAGHGRRASLITDYTFGVWDQGELVPIAKAYSGLSNEEIAEIDRWIRRHTRERFGPVRHVEPVQVFELGFEGLARSSRHRSGIAVRFPRMLRWRKDKPASEADTLETLRRMLESPSR